MEFVGDGAVEGASGKAVEGLQTLGELLGGELAHRREILVQNEAGLGILLPAVEQAGTGVGFRRLSVPRRVPNVQRALGDFPSLSTSGSPQDTDMGALEQIVPQKIESGPGAPGDWLT